MSISTITSGIGDIGSKLYGASSAITRDYQERTQTLEQVFSNLDTEGKGYLDASDFETAFAALGLGDESEESDGNLTLPGIEDVVAALDMDGDGKVSSDDLSEGMRSLTDSLSFLQGRAETWSNEALGGMPPPPPTAGQGAGFTQEELTRQLETLTASGATEDDGAVLLSSILSQFETADADSDGRVSGAEAMSFGQTLRSGETQNEEESQDMGTTASTDGSTTGREASSELLVMRRIMQLMNAYGSSYRSTGSSESLSLAA
jgi:Ca2+-binding EF-hand superfamily protein